MIFYVAIVLYSDIHKISAQFMKLKIEFVIAAVLLEALAFSIRGLRQKIFLDKLGVKMSLISNIRIFVAGYSMVVTPGGSGEVIKSHFLKRNHGASISKTAPMVFIERFHDMLAATTIIVVTLFLTKLYFWPSLSIVIITSTLLVIIYGIVRKAKILMRFQNRLLKIKFIKKLVPTQEFNETLISLSNPRIMTTGWLVSTLSWTIDALSAYVAFLAMGIDFGIVDTTQMTFTSTIFGALSFLPGGVGITEGSLIGMLVGKGLEISVASSLVLLLRLTSIWFATTLGFLSTHFVLKQKRVDFDDSDFNDKG